MKQFFNKKEVTIVVTDSGVGGMSVAAEIVERIKVIRAFQKAKIIFFNASFDNASGYNYLEDHSEKVRIFNNALLSLQKKYQPDILLIACNTLSVFYHETVFAKKAIIPVSGIIEAGIELIAEKLRAITGSKVIIFATETTINSGVHKKGLVRIGFEENRIVEQACPLLETIIEKGYQNEETRRVIEQYVSEALAKFDPEKSPFFASLNCTHYGYSIKPWEEIFRKKDRVPAGILNPNLKMVDFLNLPTVRNRYDRTEVEVEVVSRVELMPETLASIGLLLKSVSPALYDALVNYDWDEGLF